MQSHSAKTIRLQLTEATFDEFYKSDNGDNPIYNKETLDQIIGESVTFDEINELVTLK